MKKFGAHSVAPESSEDLFSKEVSENGEYSIAKGFTLVVSCAKKKCYVLINSDGHSTLKLNFRVPIP